jgi:hypothetical protein
MHHHISHPYHHAAKVHPDASHHISSSRRMTPHQLQRSAPHQSIATHHNRISPLRTQHTAIVLLYASQRIGP